MAVTSAGVLVYRSSGARPSFLLAHAGGPLWAAKDHGAWMIPKGVVEPEEAPISAAVREFEEETGLTCPALGWPLKPLRQAGGKIVLCWAAEADLDLSRFNPSDFEMEWPPRSGKRERFPEVDRVAYLEEADALARILPSQAPLIAEILAVLGAPA